MSIDYSQITRYLNSGAEILSVICSFLDIFATGLAVHYCLEFYLNWKENQKFREYDRNRTEKYGESHGCKSVVPFIPYKWPFALDLVYRQLKILFSDHTFERMTPYFDMAPTCRIHLFGHTGYFTTDPKNIRTILNTRFEDYCLGSRPLANYPLLGEGIFTQDGALWRHSRTLIKRQFSRVAKQGLGVFAGSVEELVCGIEKKAADGGIVNLKPLLFDFTLSTTTKLLFGEPHSSMPEKDREAVRDNYDRAAFGCGIRVRLADAAWLYNPPKFSKACKDVRAWASFFVTKAMQYRDDFGEDAAAEKYAFIMELWKEMEDSDLVRDQLLHVLVAGRDSTASLLSWFFFHLVRNPKTMERLQREILDSVDEENDITRKEIQKLTFLRCCLNEILRLYPSLPLNIRFANKHTILPQGGGPDGTSPVMLPEGTGIAFSIYHLHRLESIYGSDSRVFRPERWECGELIKKAGLGAGFVDFNAGPRLCLGKDFALIEASYAIIRIIQAFPNMRLPPGVPNEPVGDERQTYTIGISPAGGVQVEL